ncbi:hypothetical protein AALB39_16305 [Lachnospiraceae bacterium 54-53]
MKIRTNVKNRKEIVKAVSEIIGCPSKYLGVPSCRYQVGDCYIEKNGDVETEDEKLGALVEAGLKERGFIEAPEADEDKLMVSFSLEGMDTLNLKNLLFLIHSRQYLINKSVGEKAFVISDGLVEEMQGNEFESLESLAYAIHAYDTENKGIRLKEQKITFCFPFTTDEVKVKAYADLAAAMVRQAKDQKRIDPVERIEENEKYYMRIWLLRIGFGGKGMKESRNALMENLSGHSAFRTQADIERAKIRTKQRERSRKQAEQETQEREEVEADAFVESVNNLILEETGTGAEKTNPTEAA